MDLNLAGRRILITGASQGIGAALAHAFAAEGCNLHLTARSQAKLDKLRTEIIAANRVHVSSTAIDMTAEGAIEKIVTDAGDVDVLVNNAGVIPSGSLNQIDAQTWRDGWSLKGFGYVDMMRAVYPRMKSRGGGVILNNIGSGGEICDPLYIEGAAGNASLMAVTRALGGNSLADRIRVIGVNPGPVDTPRIYQMLRTWSKSRLGDESRYKELLVSFPLGRVAKTEEITDLFLFLASDRSGYTSGTIFTVDGGIASRRSVL